MTQKRYSSKNVNSKNRKISGKFFPLTENVLQSPEFKMLSAKAIKLLIDLGSSYNGHNNGDLSAAWKLMEQRGWKSRDTLHKAQKELESNFWIIRTRHGGRNSANLFAITWLTIDYCKGKLDLILKEEDKPRNWWSKKIRTRDPLFVPYQ